MARNRHDFCPFSLSTTHTLHCERREAMRFFGALLVILGVVLLIYGGLTLFVPAGELWLGSLSLTVHENLVIPLPPLLGLVCLIVGIIMIASAPVAVPPPPY